MKEPRPPFRTTALLLLAVAAAACTQPTTPADDNPPLVELGDPAAGELAFRDACGTCHASRDGFDVAHFAFSDTTILRRALGHVDTTTALDIVAHIRTLEVARRTPDARIFQPGGEVLESDREFAVRLFGADGWPDTLTTPGLRALDPRDVPIAVPFPLWSDEESNMDWMPDNPFPDELLDYGDGAARSRLDEYDRTASIQDLISALQVLVASDREPANAAAPCVEDGDRLQPAECFDVRRWVSSFGAQFMLRHDLDGALHNVLHDVWWDIGHVARRTVLSDGFEGEIPNALENWVTWMYAGWAFEPDRHASFYLAAGLARAELPRHATFHVLRAQVARMEGSVAPYTDAANVPRYGHEDWVMEGLSFAYRHLLERLDVGDRPDDDIAQARDEVESAFELAEPLVSTSEAEALADLRDQILARL